MVIIQHSKPSVREHIRVIGIALTRQVTTYLLSSNASAARNSNDFFLCIMVRYEDRLLNFKDLAYAFRKTKGDPAKFSLMLFNLAYAWKAKSWETEKEWRLFTKDAVGSYLQIPTGLMELTGIIFGLKMKNDIQEKVMSFITEPSHRIDTYEVALLEGSMGLQLLPYKH